MVYEWVTSDGADASLINAQRDKIKRLQAEIKYYRSELLDEMDSPVETNKHEVDGMSQVINSLFRGR